MYVWAIPDSKSMLSLTGLLANAPFKTKDGTELHCTILHCKPGTTLPDYRSITLPEDKPRYGSVVGVLHWIDHKQRDIFVFDIKSDDLSEVHDQLVSVGFQHSHPDFNPHMSIGKELELDTAQRIWFKTMNEKLNNTPIEITFNSELYATSLE